MRRKIIELNVASFQICMDALPSPTKAGILSNMIKNSLHVPVYSETLNNEYIERIHQMSYSSLSDNGILQIFSFLIK